MKKCIFIIILLLLNSLSIFPQEKQSAGDTLTYKLPEDVVVTASRLSIPLKEISFATSVVGQEILSTMPRSVSIDEALKFVPGVKKLEIQKINGSKWRNIFRNIL